MSKATYLITGGAGFIGTNLAHGLVKRGQKVIVFDNLSTGNEKNLEAIRGLITFIKGDIRDLPALQKAMSGVDYVLHQAALRAVERSVDSPLDTNEVNITGTLNVLLAARDNHVKRVVFASSSSVYGGTNAARNVETLPMNPQSPYALSKLAGEYYCRLFFQLYGLETVALRYFNVFGPYQSAESKYSAVIPIFVSQLMRDQAPVIHWHGRQSRDFTYVGNVVDANIKAATSRHVRPGEAYNIGNGENTSIKELYNYLTTSLHKNIKPTLAPKRRGDVLKTFADIRKAKRDLGYVPKTMFEQGLKKSLTWYKRAA